MPHVSAPSRGGERHPDEPYNPWEAAWKLDWDGGGTGAGTQPMSGSAVGDGKIENFFKDQKFQSNYQGPSRPNTQLQDTFRANQKYDQNMMPSDKVIDYIGEIEGFSEVPYQVHDTDPITIGYGHVIKPGEDFSGGITRDEARALKFKDIKERVDEVNDWAKINNTTLTQQQFDALVSFHYNTGKIYEMEKLRDLIKSGNATPDEIRAAFGEYYKSDGKRIFGLWKRRMDEADTYLNGDYQRKEREMPQDIEFDDI